MAAVPGLLGNHSLDGCRGRAVAGRRIPVGGKLVVNGRLALVIGAVIEVRSADGYVVGCRCKTADSQTVRRILHCIVVVAIGRAVVSGGNRHRNALRSRLLPQAAQKRVRSSQTRLAIAEAQAENRRHIAIDGMFGGKDEALFKRGVGGDHQVDSCALRHGSRPLDVKVGFDRVVVGAIGVVDAVHAGVVAVDNHLRRVGRQTEKAPELIHQGDVDVGVVDNGDGLARAVDPRAVELIEVILNGIILGRKHVAVACAAAAHRPLRRCLVGLGIVAGFAEHMGIVLQAEIVQRNEPTHYRSKRCRNLRIVGVGVMRLAVHHILMHLGMEGAAQLGRAA